MEKYLEIRDDLINDSIDITKAFEQLKKLPKPWSTKHWKNLRDSNLKDNCENCGTSEPPLVIQHTKHPLDYKVHYENIMKDYIDYEKIKVEMTIKHATENKITKFLEQNSRNRESCPVCGTINVRKNNKKNIFICVKQHIFEVPVFVLYFNESRTTDYDKAKESASKKLVSLAVSKEMKMRREKYNLKVGKEAMLNCFEEGIEYRLFKHVKTLCKRCAAIEDGIVPKYILCQKCKGNYHSPSYETCLKCWDGTKK